MHTQSNLKGTKGTMYFLSVVVYFYNKLINMYIEVFCTGFSCIIVKGKNNQCHQLSVPVNMYFSFIDNSTINSFLLKKIPDEAGTSSLNGRGLEVCKKLL